MAPRPAPKKKPKKAAEKPKNRNPAPMEFVGRKHTFIAGDRLGMGGMAEVFRAKSEDGLLEVAIKKPLAHLSAEKQAMFLREAEAASKASGSGVVQVIDWGDAPPFIAFELITDPNLEMEIVRRKAANERWSVTELAAMFVQLASAMKTVNQYVLHRDLKPANIFAGPLGVRVSDFGLAKYVDEATRSRTFKNWGTSAYIAPEAWGGESVDWRADQYSLGVVFFELATLQRPFSGNEEELEQKHLFRQPARPETLAPELPPRLASVITRMLEKRREDRFASWDQVSAEVTAALQSFAGPIKGGGDPLVRAAIDKLHEHKQVQLAAAKAESDIARTRAERRGVVGYWWTVFSEKIKARIDLVNRDAGQVITSSIREGNLEATFINARLRLFLEPISHDGVPEVIGWGVLKATTPLGTCVVQLLLLKEPLPYGQWLEVDMVVSPMVQRPITSGDLARKGWGGSYEFLGSSRLVVAQDAAGLLGQRSIKNVTSMVDYREHPLNFDASLAECLDFFVKGATATRPSDHQV